MRVVSVLICATLFFEVDAFGNDTSENTTLRRKKRFLLYPPGANMLFTSSFLKGLVFKAPTGYVVIGELDMYYPLPDYNYHASSLRLGQVAKYPDPPKPPPKLIPMVEHPMPMDPKHDHHHEPTAEEVQKYLEAHPNAWVPPGWNKDRMDTVSPYYSSPSYNNYSPSLNKYLSYQPTARYRRSTEEEDHEKHKWLTGETHNISHHRNWEHFHHYRDRRELFSRMEDAISAISGIHMKDCILRSICEAKNMLPPPGRSMALDIFRVMFSYPLHDDLTDNYTETMRASDEDCHEKYSDGCPLSILQMILFGKFVT